MCVSDPMPDYSVCILCRDQVRRQVQFCQTSTNQLSGRKRHWRLLPARNSCILGAMGAATPQSTGVWNLLPSCQKAAGWKHHCCRQTSKVQHTYCLYLMQGSNVLFFNTQDLKDFLTGAVQTSQYIRQPEINLSGLPLQQEVGHPLINGYNSCRDAARKPDSVHNQGYQKFMSLAKLWVCCV